MAKRLSVWSCGCAQVGDKLKEKTKLEKDPIDLYSEELLCMLLGILLEWFRST